MMQNFLEVEIIVKIYEVLKLEPVLYSIPVFDDFLNNIDDKLKNEKLHTGNKKSFEQFNFNCIGNNGRYYFMKKSLAN